MIYDIYLKTFPWRNGPIFAPSGSWEENWFKNLLNENLLKSFVKENFPKQLDKKMTIWCKEKFFKEILLNGNLRKESLRNSQMRIW